MRAFAVNRWFVAASLAYAVAGLIVARQLGVAEQYTTSHDFTLEHNYIRQFLIFGLIGAAFVLAHLLNVFVFLRPKQPLRYLRESFFEINRMPERLLTALPVLILLPISLTVFSSLKVMIPLIHPFDWDATFIAWDGWLHGGVQPWEILQPILGFPYVTHVINICYDAWFFLLFLSAFVMAFKLTPPRLRMQFFLTLLVSWSLLGNLMAAALASVGPAFYGLLTGGPDPFAPLMAYLNAANEHYEIGALQVQDWLWSAYEAKENAVGRGISAMPSIHVASALLFALVWWRLNRVVGILMAVFCAVILLGSVHLGYHYAIDGYVAILLTWLIWHVIGRLLDRDRSLDEEEKAPAVQNLGS
jgi:hypothetical protein